MGMAIEVVYSELGWFGFDRDTTTDRPQKSQSHLGTGCEELMEPSSAILRRFVLVFVLILVGIAFFVPSLLILRAVVTARLGLGTGNVLVAV